MRLSIVTTLYESAPYLEEFYRRSCAAAERVTGDFEIILVNDGSPDDSLDIAVGLYHRDPRVRVIDLARNFAHHRSMMTGLAYARGDLVVLLDADLEEEPELIELLYNELAAHPEADVIYGVQPTRKGGWFERVTGELFYRVFNALSSYPIPVNDLTARIMTRRYVDSLVAHREREVFLGGLFASTGYIQLPVLVEKHYKGSSSYTTGRKLAMVINAITSFSNKPLVFVFYLGCFIVGVSIAAALFLVARKIVFGHLLMGWPSLMVSIWLLGGLTIFCIGVIGIYLSKVFMETKQRPYTIVRRVYER